MIQEEIQEESCGLCASDSLDNSGQVRATPPHESSSSMACAEPLRPRLLKSQSTVDSKFLQDASRDATRCPDKKTDTSVFTAREKEMRDVNRQKRTDTAKEGLETSTKMYGTFAPTIRHVYFDVNNVNLFQQIWRIRL
jgi:hypothetical protein